MNNPVLVTSCLLLLVALFPCQNVIVERKESYSYNDPNWGKQSGERVADKKALRMHLFVLSDPPDGVSINQREPFAWGIIAAEILAAFAIGAITWAIARPKESPASGTATGASPLETPREPQP